MKWLKIVGSIIEYVVLPWLRARKMEKKAEQLEKVANTVIAGVESYNNTADKSDLKTIIKNIAKSTGAQYLLEEKLIKLGFSKPK